MSCPIIIQKGINKGMRCSDVHTVCTSYRHLKRRKQFPINVNIKMNYSEGEKETHARLKSMIKVILKG